MSGLIARRGMMAKTGGSKYIVFEDPAVEAICIQRCSSDGIGVTYEDAAAVTNINGWFYNNSEITKFNEFQYFTKVGRLDYNALSVCNNLKELTFSNQEIIWIYDQRALGVSRGSRTFNIPSLDWWYRFYYRSSNFIYQPGALTLKVNGIIPTVATIPEGEVDISIKPFGGLYTNIKQFSYINMPNLRTIGRACFSDTTWQELQIPDTVETIGTDAFTSASLKEGGIKTILSLPVLKSLSDESFMSVNVFSKVMNLGNITNLPNRCFLATGISEIHLPSTLLTIGRDRCITQGQFISLSVHCHAVTPPTFPDGYNSNTISAAHIYVPSQSVEAYKAADGWSQWASKIEAIPE